MVIALLLAFDLAISRRSRQGLFILSVFSLSYFGFYREGCICPIGAIQNVTMTFFDSNYIIPLSAFLFFILPLIFAIFFGRVFCSGVCPLGAIQEVFIYKHIRLPVFLKIILGLIPFIYLGLAVLFVATDSMFLICKYDPFVGFFRLSASYQMAAFGAVLLIIGLFIARPYCRFLCPYGVILGIFSVFSMKHIKITPDECIQCKLCEDVCPVDAINKPSPRYKDNKSREIKKLGMFILSVPIIMIIMGYSFSKTYNFFSRFNKTVSLAEEISAEETGKIKEFSLDGKAFKEKGIPVQRLFDDALKIQGRFKIGLWFFGMYLALVISIKIIVLMLRNNRTDYEPDKFNCVSCGRCMEYCPYKDGE